MQHTKCVLVDTVKGVYYAMQTTKWNTSHNNLEIFLPKLCKN